jgi:hypothetical protein
MGTVTQLQTGLVAEARAVLARLPRVGSFAVLDPTGLDSPQRPLLVKVLGDMQRRRAQIALRTAGFRTISHDGLPFAFYVERCQPGQRACVHCNSTIPEGAGACAACAREILRVWEAP